MVTIPQAIAYAFLAGVPPQSGLYACLVPMVLYAIFGSSKQLVVGPVAVAALMVAAAVAEHAPKYSDAYLGITTVLCLQSGIILWLLRLSRMGGLVNLLSHPVITGFVNAAAILIIVSQLPAFTGIAVNDTTSPFTTLASLLENIDALDPLTLLFGASALALLIGFKPVMLIGLRAIAPSVADDHAFTRLGPMVAAAVAILIVGLVGLEGEITLVGFVPAGLPELAAPPFNLTLWLELLPSAAIIAVISYIESFSIGTTLAARKQDRINPHQELIALGAANVGAAFTGAYPVAGSFSRSSVNYASGARTPVSSLVCAGVIVIALIFFTGLFALLPHAVLAAIVMISVVGLMDLKSSREHWSIYRHDTITELATLGLVLFMGVEIGLITGVLLSIAFFIRTSSRPNITQVGRLGDTEQFRSIKRYDVETLPHVLALRVDENIYFANATQIENKLIKRVQKRRSTKHLLVVCSSVNMIDATGLQMLSRLNQHLAQADIRLHLCDIKGPLMAQLKGTDLETALSGEIFFNADRAMRKFAEELQT
jgi:SulP family sulfate permease